MHENGEGRKMVTLPGPDWHGPWQVPEDAEPHMVNGICYGYLDLAPGVSAIKPTAADVAAQLAAQIKP